MSYQPAYRNVVFTFVAGAAGSDPTASMTLVIMDSGGITRGIYPLEPSQTTLTVVLPVDDGYVATLESYDAYDTPNPVLQSVTFNVTAAPPPALTPSNPTLNAPTLD
jgi:hypothetical protein